MKINWSIKHFSEFTTEELYKIFHLRLEVFSVEQNCAYQDADGKDLNAFHIMGINESGELIAYARILPAGTSFKEVSIGRVITSKKIRGTGVGKILMRKCMEFIAKKFGGSDKARQNVRVRISAQCYLRKFYEGFGFVVDSAEYLEDNMPHMEMLKK